MKKLSALLLTLTVVLTLAACGTGEPAENSSGNEQTDGGGQEKYVVGIAMDSMEDFNVYVVNGLNAYAAENSEKVEILMSDADYDSAQQISSVENFIANGVDAVVIKAVDSEGCGAISQMCEEVGIPLVVVNTPITSDYTCLVGSDNVNCGVIQGEYAAELLNHSGKIAILYGDPAHDGSRSRTEGVQSVIDGEPNMEIVSTQTGNWGRDEGMQIAENWIQSGIEIDAILSNNDEMAIGAMLAYEDAGTEMIIMGVDALPEACELIKEGRLSGSVFQDGYMQAYTAMDATIRILDGEDVEEYIEVPFELVTKETADEYLAKYN